MTKYYDNTIVGYSYSKSLSLPGERIGYLVIPDEADGSEELITAAAIANRTIGCVNAPSLMQKVIAKCVDAEVDVAAYDKNRLALYNGLKEYGLSVPDDISVVGYDDIFFSEILDTPLTTIRQPVYEMGVEGMKLLLNEVESTNHIKKCITFQPKIIIRESVKNVRR